MVFILQFVNVVYHTDGFVDFFFIFPLYSKGVRLSLHVYITITVFPPPFLLNSIENYVQTLMLQQNKERVGEKL